MEKNNKFKLKKARKKTESKAGKKKEKGKCKKGL